MGIELRQIRLLNWKCYRDVKVQLAPSDDRRIWILFGGNGAGKTSLLDAVRWCLYGGDAIPPSTLLDYFHRSEVEHNPSLTLEVSLLFDRDGHAIHISRAAKRVVKGSTPWVSPGEPLVTKDGIAQPDSRGTIESLLPRACSQFFFFDGVDIKRYAIAVHKPETRDAIERVLGIPELRNLRDDARDALGEFERRLARRAEDEKGLGEVEDKLEGVREQLRTLDDQVRDAREARDAAQALHESNRDRAKQLQGLRGKLDDVARLEREHARLSEQLHQTEESIEETMKEAPVHILFDSIRSVALQLQTTTLTAARRGGSEQQLDALLKQAHCLCGREMDEPAREHIRRELERLQKQGSASKESVHLDGLRQELDRIGSQRGPDLGQLLLTKDELEEGCQQAAQALSALKKDTGDLDVDEDRLIWKKVAESESWLRERSAAIEGLLRSLEAQRKEESDLLRERAALEMASQELRNLVRQASFARSLLEAAEELIEWRIRERKATIEELTTKFYLQVTNKPDEYTGVVIRDDYTLAVRTSNERLLNTETLSAGEKEALAFSFIAALNAASSTSALFIMDTPFGHLDGTHQRNLVQSLASITYQVIVLATDRDFPESMLTLISSHVAQKLEIRRLSVLEDSSSVEVLS